MVISKVVPLFLLVASVLMVDIKLIPGQLKVLWQAVSRVNERAGVFPEKVPPAVFHPQLPISEQTEDGS
ncbi:hypothetical protein KDW_53430 [Dictyobacter vulcani]|uniref:Uncharacterized protein n=1 Tax=Dictyobacter vulcani TaxID=2607529 RepID=A0A5J4KXH3_9CHLR|nr:hypothetical protein KDW_53430 [Dictyobacter vulcani]